MSKLTIKVHEASPRKYRQHPSQRIGVVNDAGPFIARKRELDARAEAWKTCLDQGVCLHEQGFRNTLSGMLDDALSKIPHSDFDGVRIELDPDSDGLLCIWWSWVYDGNEFRIAPDKWVTVETGAGSFWQKAMQAMIDKTIHLSTVADAIIARVFAVGDSESIQYGIKFDEDGMSRYLVKRGYPSIKESAKLITDEIVPVWEKLVKASVIADKELVREFKPANTAESKKNEDYKLRTYANGQPEIWLYGDELTIDVRSSLYDFFKLKLKPGETILNITDSDEVDDLLSGELDGVAELVDWVRGEDSMGNVHTYPLVKVLDFKAESKQSEKRTVTKSYDVYTYDELSDEAKGKVKDLFLSWRADDDTFTDGCETTLTELFPNSDLKVQYSLSSSQGDGFNTYGKLKVDDLLNVDTSLYPLNQASGIAVPESKAAIKAACDKADVTELELPYNNHYCYSLADQVEVSPDYDVELTKEETGLLSDLENFAQSVMGKINRQFEKDGYDWFYEMSDEEAQEQAEANDYEFTEDGELA